jgi:hypothetical protein
MASADVLASAEAPSLFCGHNGQTRKKAVPKVNGGAKKSDTKSNNFTGRM